MNRYKKLASNTFTFAIGTFSSKFLVFFMLPLYTRTLSSAEYGEVDLVVQACNLMIPIASVGIMDAVIRFGLDGSANKKGVFSFGLVTCLLGFVLLWFAKPLFMNIEFLSDNIRYVYLYVFKPYFTHYVPTLYGHRNMSGSMRLMVSCERCLQLS